MSEVSRSTCPGPVPVRAHGLSPACRKIGPPPYNCISSTLLPFVTSHISALKHRKDHIMSDRPPVKRFKPKAPGMVAAASATQVPGVNSSSGASTRTASPAGPAGTAGAGGAAGAAGAGGSSAMQRVGTGSSGGARSAASTPGPGAGAAVGPGAGAGPGAPARPGAGVGAGPSGLMRPAAVRTATGASTSSVAGSGVAVPPRTGGFQKFKPKVASSAAIKACVSLMKRQSI